MRQLTIDGGSQIDGNSAPTGGVIYNDGCAVTICNNSSFSDNRRDRRGERGEVAPWITLSRAGSIRSSRFSTNNALDGGAPLQMRWRQRRSGWGNARREYRRPRRRHREQRRRHHHRQPARPQQRHRQRRGGFQNVSGPAPLERSTVSGNTAFEGGGISTYGTSRRCARSILSATWPLRRAAAAPMAAACTTWRVVFVTDATISGNGPGTTAAGIYQVADDNLTLTNVTLADNAADVLGGGCTTTGAMRCSPTLRSPTTGAGAAGAAIYEDPAADTFQPRRRAVCQ